MNRKAYASILAFICLALGFLTGCNNSSSASQGVSITATSGTPQNATVGPAFLVPLAATVMSKGSPVSGVAVTFTAPATKASGTFKTSGTATETDMTNANGVATSSVFTADATLGGPYTVTASAPRALVPASFSLTNTATGPFADTITATAGTPQSVPTGTPFAVLQATVTSPSGAPASGVAVTFTAPATGASGTFANGTATETDMTNANGVATSSVFTANATVGGPYMVTASAPLASAPAGFSLTNTAAVTSNNYTFYLSGVAGVSGPGSTYYFYDLAGSVAIAADGTIVGGEQDFNQVNGYKSPQPSGDKITGGTLTVSATTGQGTLTLITNNTNLGVYGT